MSSTGSENNTNKKRNTIISGELAEKITQGDASATNEFVQLNYGWLLFIIRKKFTRSNNHEDIVQDTFMLVISKLKQGNINNPQGILAFLRTTAINIGFEYLRKDKKFISAIDQDLLNFIVDNSDDILSNIIWDDRVHYVKQVINELRKPRDKDILIQYYFHDQDKKNICTLHNLSSKHFDRVLYRAKLRLKELIHNKNKFKGNSNNNLKMNIDSKKGNTKWMSKLIALINIPLLMYRKIQSLKAIHNSQSIGVNS